MKIYIFILLVAVFTNATSQKTIRINYVEQNFFPTGYFEKFSESERENYKLKMIQPRLKTLVNNGSFSLYVNEVLENKADINTLSANGLTNALLIPNTWIYKDFNNSVYYTKQNLLGEEYVVQEKFPDNEVIFSSKIKKIDKFNCKLAFIISKKDLNDTIKFWYTQDIAIIDGPFRPFAIPGLILGYENKYKNIYATKIEFEFRKNDSRRLLHTH